MLTKESQKVADKIIEEYGGDKSTIITVLHKVQDHYRYLPKDILIYISEKMNISLAKVFGVATFYENFSLEPKGKYIIKICDGTACHVRNSIPILNAIRNELGLSESKTTTDDLLFTIETVSCLGACGLAPVITINDEVYPKMTPKAVVELLNNVRKGEEGNDDKK